MDHKDLPNEIDILISRDMVYNGAPYKSLWKCPLAVEAQKLLNWENISAGTYGFTLRGPHMDIEAKYDLEVPFREIDYSNIIKTGKPFITKAKRINYDRTSNS